MCRLYFTPEVKASRLEIDYCWTLLMCQEAHEWLDIQSAIMSEARKRAEAKAKRRNSRGAS